MSIAFVIGNGISRKDIDLNLLKQQGRIYGCNALYREFTPDVLVATDTPIATAIQESGYAKISRFYTRKPIEGSGALPLLANYSGYSSGPNALGMACIDGNFTVYLLGFDMGPAENNLFNNIYADTEFYKTSAHPPTFVKNWAIQMKKIMSDHKLVRFIRVQGPATAHIAEFDFITNLTHLDLSTFTDRINNKKDL
jgi:hypothetical protein